METMMGHYASEMGMDLSKESERLFKKYDALIKKLGGISSGRLTISQVQEALYLLSDKGALSRSHYSFSGDPKFALKEAIGKLEKLLSHLSQ